MSQVQEVKQAIDIVQIINERVPLQHSGMNWRGLCPFHSEKSPSFFVSEQMQRYKCFGCGESGDVFTFLEKYESMTFGEGLQYLAERAGITLTKLQFTPEDDQRQRLHAILDLTKEYYHYLLTEHKHGEPARQYLKERGISAESIRLFQMGYSLPSWEGLIRFLHVKKKYSLEDLRAAGLTVQGKGGQSYDRFRGRLMFPLTNQRGQVVGFSGRVLDPKEKEAKYINSPETLLYHKSQLLFGFSHLHQEIRKAAEVIVVEGEFDVVSSAQAHVNNVVAVKGSALTEDHVKLLSRTVKKILLCFDFDSAGVTATKRAIEVARPFDVELRVIPLSPQSQNLTEMNLTEEMTKMDPDDLARKHPQVWRQLAKSSISIYEFLLQAALRQSDPSTPEGKRKIIDELAPVFRTIEHAVELEYYSKRLAEVLQVKAETVRIDLERFAQAKRFGQKYEAKPKTTEITVKPVLNRRQKVEKYLFFLILQMNQHERSKAVAQLKQLETLPGELRSLAEKLETLPSGQDISDWAQLLPDDQQQLIFELSLDPEYLAILPEVDKEKEWANTLNEYQEISLTEQILSIEQQLNQLEKQKQLSPEIETKQLQLLQRVVQLKAQQKISN